MPGLKKVFSGNTIKKNIPLCAIILFFTGFFFWIYHRYIPRISDVQFIFVPLIGICLILTAVSLQKGTFFFIFCIPLLNSFPNFLGLSGFNPLFVVFYAYFLGVLIHQLIRPFPWRWPVSLSLPIIGAAAVIFLSALITLWRYIHFFPLRADAIYEWTVNVLNVSAGESIRLVLFHSLNYLAGFLWFFCVISVLKTRALIRKSIIFLAISTAFSFAFGFLQAFISPELGNTDFWLAKGQINALFTDPNALGVYMALVFPLFVGAYLTFLKSSWKALFVFILSIGIILMPQSGSRSGLLGLILAAFVFVFFILKRGGYDSVRKARLIRESLVVFIIFCSMLTVAVLTGKDSILVQRIFPSQETPLKTESRIDILNARQVLWPAGFHMVKEFPLSGVGIGSFTSELPNYYIKYGLAPVMTSAMNREMPLTQPVLVDTSGNFYLQLASEMGIIALIFFLWIFVSIAKKGWQSCFQKNDDEYSFLKAGMFSGVLALFVIFMFGVHTLSFEIQMIFWLLVGFLYANSEGERERIRLNRTGLILLSLAVAVFAVCHVRNSLGDLSLSKRTQNFRLIQSFGFYIEEVSNGREFRWTKKAAGMTVRMEKPALVVPIHAAHPDIAKRPLRLRIYTSQNLFEDEELVADLIIKNNRWQTIQLAMPEKIGQDILLVFEVSRTWQPLKRLGTPDPRHLGVAVGELSFKGNGSQLQKTPPKIRMTLVDKLTQSEWMGRQGPKLYETGRCWIDVSLLEGEYVFKLWARGEPAEDIWPYLVFWIDDEMIGETWVLSSDWKAHEFAKKVTKGSHRIRVVFANDFYVIKPDGDRNLVIGDLDIYRKE